eukprot:TRINITY_DN63990_c0_g1_i1.p1 TRINITY_DN63990_c0_g1~~TRINITY_DN63990_c0_g1_i1.p1  ORF type:complete len:751 (+),score=131.73 TRINITY_DN63990_c0_g1_i1:83-2335(+)
MVAREAGRLRRFLARSFGVLAIFERRAAAEPPQPVYDQPCWTSGFSRPLCCDGPSQIRCFSAATGFTKKGCCGQAYDLCVLLFRQKALEWRGKKNSSTCADFVASGDTWLSQNCLTWWPGDRTYEQSVVNDVLEAEIARCFYVDASLDQARNIRIGVCVPYFCSEADLYSNIFDFVDLPRLTLMDIVPGTPSLKLAIEELAPWRALQEKMDFVIAGFPNSGTSTLAASLAAHPEIDLDPAELDIPQALQQSSNLEGDWRNWLCADVLTRDWLEKRAPRPLTAKAAASTARGFKNPLLLYSDSCLRSLSQAGLRLLVVLRDPIEWLLSIFRHNKSTLGLMWHDWVAPDLAATQSSFFGRDHARFGSILAKALSIPSGLLEQADIDAIHATQLGGSNGEGKAQPAGEVDSAATPVPARRKGSVGYWPLKQVLVVELEHLKKPATAAIALDAVAEFIGVTPFSELHAASEASPGSGAASAPEAKASSPSTSPLRYAPGLASSSPLWSHRQLCAPAQAPHLKALAASLSREYRILPRLLSYIGVQHLGVSSVIAAGGAFARHCVADQYHVPKAVEKGEDKAAASDSSKMQVEKGEAGWAEAAAVEGRLLLNWHGEVGFEFEVTSRGLRIAALGCGAGAGPVRDNVRVTLWDVASREPIHVSLVGPGSVMYDGFAYSAPFSRPMELKQGRRYALTVHVSPGLGLAPSGHWAIGIDPEVARFKGGVYSHAPWKYPTERDSSAWEQAYCTIVTMHSI